jgi:CBS domain containing-hemolysin-like protein
MRQKWLNVLVTDAVDGAIQIDEFKELLGVEGLPGEETGIYNTLAGFILHRLGRIPQKVRHLNVAFSKLK